MSLPPMACAATGTPSWLWCGAPTSHWWLALTRCRWVMGQCSVYAEVQQVGDARKWVKMGAGFIVACWNVVSNYKLNIWDTGRFSLTQRP